MGLGKYSRVTDTHWLRSSLLEALHSPQLTYLPSPFQHIPAHSVLALTPLVLLSTDLHTRLNFIYHAQFLGARNRINSDGVKKQRNSSKGHRIVCRVSERARTRPQLHAARNNGHRKALETALLLWTLNTTASSTESTTRHWTLPRSLPSPISKIGSALHLFF